MAKAGIFFRMDLTSRLPLSQQGFRMSVQNTVHPFFDDTSKHYPHITHIVNITCFNFFLTQTSTLINHDRIQWCNHKKQHVQQIQSQYQFHPLLNKSTV